MVLSLLSVPLASVHENHSKLPIKKMVWLLLLASVVYVFLSFTENGVILLLKMHTHTHIFERFASVWYNFLLWIRFFQKTFPFWICIIFWISDLFSLSLSTLCINWRRVNDNGDIIYQFSYLAQLRKNNDALGFNKNVIFYIVLHVI